jgi:urea transporter
LTEDGAVVQIYDGIWGYNSLLAMAAVSCVFFPFSPASFVAGLINTIGTVAIHAALRASMDKVEMCLNVVVLLGIFFQDPRTCALFKDNESKILYAGL